MRLVTAGFLLLLLAACGGGGNGGDGGGDSRATPASTPSNTPPVANAGADFQTDEGSRTTLNGSASRDSDGSISTWSWRQVSGPTVAMMNPDEASPGFDAPSVSANTDMVFELTVRDDDGASDTDRVTVTVMDLNVPPTANAGEDFTIAERLTATLDGSSSTDSDGSVAAYAWLQLSGRPVTIENDDQAVATFLVPEVPPGGEDLEFELIVTDNEGSTGSDYLTISVLDVNLPPTANAGPDRSEPESTAIVLDATGSTDDAGINAYRWEQISGPAVVIDQANTATASLTTPAVTVAGALLEFELTVTDAQSLSSTDRIVISVFNVNIAPTADAGSDQAVYEGQVITLDGSNSSDADGTIEEYTWMLYSGIIADIPDLDQPVVSFTAPDVAATIENTYRLTVTDELGDSSSDFVTVTIQPIIPPISNAGPDQTVESGTAVQLSGANSSDSDGEIVAYEWSQLAGPSVSLDDSTIAEPSFSAPVVAELTLFQFELIVTDNTDATSSDLVDITVTPPQHDVSGSITVPEGNLSDSDVNDVDAPYESNDSVDTAQYLPGAVTVGGYANRQFQGANGRSFSSGDAFDIYRLELSSGQRTVLYIGDFANGDLDLYLWDLTGTQIIDASTGVTGTEVVVAPSDGEYLLEVFVWSGASNYVMDVESSASPGSVDSPLSLHQQFAPHEAVVRHKASPAQAKAQSFSKATAAALGMQAPARAESFASLYSVAPSVAGMAAVSGAPTDELERRSQAFKDATMRAKWETLLAIKMIGADPTVQYAEPNFLRQVSFVPDDEGYVRQWHYPFINVDDAWDTTLGDPSVVVAVVDEGVLVDHPDLVGNMANGYDFIRSTSISNDGDGIDPDPNDPGASCGAGNSAFHGTHVQGTIGAATDNQIGVAGVAPGATMMPLRALGCGGGFSYDIAQAVLYAAGQPNDSDIIVDDIADVINLSLGGSGYSQFSQDAYTAARNAGVIVVAAAGNSTSSAPFYPAGYDGVISVSSVGSTGVRAGYSNFGPNTDVTAPGGDTSADLNEDGYPDLVYSTDGDDDEAEIEFTYEYKRGTSMAAPHVAGVIALMKSVNDALTPADIDVMLIRGEIVVDIGEPGWDQFYGWGLIDAQIAVDAAIAAIGSPPADSPAMVVDPLELQFGSFTSSAELEISNLAGGTLVVDEIAIPPEASWLSILPQAVDANGVGTYDATVDRAGLAEGVYSTSITITSNANSRIVAVEMRVPPADLDFSPNAGYLWVLFIDPDTGGTAFFTRAELEDGQLNYSIADVYEGTYRILAGSDSDYDFIVCENGESCGGYPDLATPSDVLIDADTTDLDFSVDYSQNLPGASGASVSPNQGFRVPQNE